MRGVRRGLLSLALMLWAAGVASAQNTSGNVSGRVLDHRDAAIPGAAVNATNGATGFNRATVTEEEGVYRLTALPVGTYEIKVELAGFSTQAKEVVVQVGANIDVNFGLAMQSLSESVQVQA